MIGAIVNISSYKKETVVLTFQLSKQHLKLCFVFIYIPTSFEYSEVLKLSPTKNLAKQD